MGILSSMLSSLLAYFERHGSRDRNNTGNAANRSHGANAEADVGADDVIDMEFMGRLRFPVC